MGMHGGDIYQNQVNIDFSVNINPFGVPADVKVALQKAVEEACHYPEYQSVMLTEKVSAKLNVPKENIVFGNGASELFMAVMRALSPDRVRIPVPSFYGYEYAAGAVGAKIDYFTYEKKDSFTFPALDTAGIPQWMSALTEDTECIFLAHPNNPTGKIIEKSVLLKLLQLCREKKITVILDECFIEFCRGAYSLLPDLSDYPNVILVRAFTKIYAIPGVRLGYLVGFDAAMLERIRAQLPEWNLSVFAQKAGAACMAQEEYVRSTLDFIAFERAYLEERLQSVGLKTYPGEANFILFYSEKPLYEALLRQGILIRNCENIRGLGKGYYRVAVKLRKENDILWKAIGECVGKENQ